MARGGGGGCLLLAARAAGRGRGRLLPTTTGGVAAAASGFATSTRSSRTSSRKRPLPYLRPPPSSSRPPSSAAATVFTMTSSPPPDGTVREHRVQRVVPFTCEQLFDVVADVGKYKLFLPYCKDSVVLRRTPPHFMVAQLLIGFNSALGERYSSRVRLERPRAITTAALDSSIFSRLESAWRFHPGPEDPTNTAAVDFTVRFQVRNPVARAAVDVVFRDVAAAQMRAFEQRCHAVYGGGGGGEAGGGAREE